MIAQVALSVVLVVAPGLFARTFMSLTRRDIHFDRDRVLIIDISAQHANVDPARRLALYERTREAVRALPGTVDATVSLVTPVSGMVINPRIEVPGAVMLPGSDRSFANDLVLFCERLDGGCTGPRNRAASALGSRQ